MFAVLDIVITGVAASGSLIEFCRGTLTTSLLGAALSILLSSPDALEIGSSNMGIVWATFLAGVLSIGAAVLSEGNTNCVSIASSLTGLIGIYPASFQDSALDFSLSLWELSLDWADSMVARAP